MFSFLRSRGKSLKNAINGIKLTFYSEINFRIHFLAFFLVILFAFYFKLSTFEWLVILLISAVILAAEMINTSIEFLTDLLKPEYSERAKRIKDISAAAVFLLAIFSVIIAVIIFLPKIFNI